MKKKRITKKLISILLAAVLSLSVMTIAPFSVSAATYNVLFPVKNGILAYYYGNTASYGGWHSGIDIHSNGDDTIYAGCSGVVEATANSCWHVSCGYQCEHYSTYGNYIRIRNNDGTKSYYGHLLQNSLKVSVGDTVRQGQAIATMGSSGYSTGKHLHYEMRLSDNSTINVNPTGNGGSVNYSYSPYGGNNDTECPTISDIKATNISSNSFTINCYLNDNVGVTRVWLNIYGPGGSNGYEVKTSNGNFSHTINTSNYGGAGLYSVHIYAFDGAGNEKGASLSNILAKSDTDKPVITDVRPTNVSDSSFTINCNLSDNVGVTRVWLNIYGPGGSNGYEVITSNGNFSHTINTSNYGGAGLYSVHIYAFDGAGNETGYGLNNFYVKSDNLAPKITSLSVSNISDSAFTINCKSNEKIVRAWIHVIGPDKTEGYAINMYDESFIHNINTEKYGGSGNYEIHVYVWDAAGNESVGRSTGVFSTDFDSYILGDINQDNTVTISDVTVLQQYCAQLIDLNDNQLYLADVNNDGYVDIADVTLIQTYIAGHITSFSK